MPPIPLWVWILGAIIGTIGSGLLMYRFWEFSGAIISGVQQASPGIGAMMASTGMLFTLLPSMIMFMMMMWIMTTFARLFE